MANPRGKPSVQVNLPNNLVAVYSDSAYLSINQYGIIIDFAQRMGPTNQQNIVARVGMSKSHAKILIEKLAGLLVKSELHRKQVTHSPTKKKMVN